MGTQTLPKAFHVTRSESNVFSKAQQALVVWTSFTSVTWFPTPSTPSNLATLASGSSSNLPDTLWAFSLAVPAAWIVHPTWQPGLTSYLFCFNTSSLMKPILASYLKLQPSPHQICHSQFPYSVFSPQSPMELIAFQCKLFILFSV